MSRVDLHPEELLEKEARGTLTDAEWVRLEAHLASCETCRFERLVREDFQVELEENATALVLLDAKVAPPSPLPTPIVAPDEPGRATRSRDGRLLDRGRRVQVVWVAVPLMVSAVAAASVAVSVAQHRDRATTGSNVEQRTAPVQSSVAPSVRQPLPATTISAAPSADPGPLENTTSEGTTSEDRRSPSWSAAPSRIEPPPPSAASLFADANAARRQGAYGESIQLYREILSRYPRSREAATTRAVLGSVLLDRGDAAAALSYFDAYLAGGAGAVREEALVGRATALGRLGRAGEEAAAWDTLLEQYPSSVHAERARQRLATIRGE